MSNINKKTFSLINRISKSFTLYIANFALSVTFIFRIRDRVRLFFTPILALRMVSTITIKRIRLTISQMKLTEKITQTINARRVKITYVFKEALKAVTIFTFKNVTTFIMKERDKVVTIIRQKAPLTFVAILGTFYTLLEYDPDTLSATDAITLGVLDYTVL